MTRPDHRLGLGVAFIIAAFAILAAVAEGQPTDPALLLARTCVSERGWDLTGDDCAAIAAVAARRASIRGTSISRALVELSPRLHGDEPIPRPWLRHLEPDGRRPRGWTRASWERRGPEWLATLAEARAILAGERPSPCAEEPSSWGSRADVRAALAASGGALRWREVSCGNTRNLFGAWERRAGR